jgi:2-iminobutanoate/2-iminopropanoate deaminase
MKNLGAVLEASGCSFPQVVKTTVLLTDMADFAAVNAIYGKALLKEHEPTHLCASCDLSSTLIQHSSSLPL